MAKGDDARSRNQITYQGNRGATLGENLRTGTLEPNVGMFRDKYFQPAADQQMGDYGNIMSGYKDFAKTGGFSPEDIGNIRARSVSPTRAMYSNAQQNVNRQRTLQGGYSPGFGVLQARMARQGSSALSDASTNAEGMIAQLKQQGKLAGMSGASSLYGTTPGMTSTFANGVLGSTGQLGQGVANEMGFGNQVAQNQIEAGRLPGKMDSTLNTIGGVAKIGQTVGSTLYPWLA